MTAPEVRTIAVPGGRVRCEVYPSEMANGEALPLLCLHGGPGAGSTYLEPLAALADDRPVAMWDQLGCGRSDIPDDLSLWTIERFLAEVEAVADALSWDRFVLYGHSWGGWLGLEHALAHPGRAAALVLHSTSASAKSFTDYAATLIDALPSDARDAIHKHEAAGTYDHPEFEAAVGQFYARHLCRLDPWPEAMLQAVAALGSTPVYPNMNGPTEFTITGSLASFDRHADLGRIDVPALVLCGEHDEIGPPCTRELAEGLPDAATVVIAGASHKSMLETPTETLQAIRTFLDTAPV